VNATQLICEAGALALARREENAMDRWEQSPEVSALADVVR
jgi:hypothetical protein